MVNMKLPFINVSFRHDSAYVIQKWLRLEKKVIRVKLAYTSKVFPNGYNYCGNGPVTVFLVLQLA